MNKYGYIRVSTKEQNVERQWIALQECGIENDKIYLDYTSGRDFMRPQYKKLLKKIGSSSACVK